MMLNYIRAFLYSNFIYPSLKKKIKQLPIDKRYPKNLYFIIPSYKEESWVSVETFKSIIKEIEKIPTDIDVTIIVSTATKKEDELIAKIFDIYDSEKNIELIFQHQKDGKRIAMGHALRVLARKHEYKDDPNSVTIFMDGDSYLENDFFIKLLPFFAIEKNLGAVTTNETAYIKTNSRWYKEWFKLKFAQRHILFQSHSLSKKVLTLTGRLSAYKTSIVIEEDFIKIIENDIITHPVHGKFRFLMGDDKSSWFYLLKNNYDMLYLPDVLCYSLESRDGEFLKLSQSLPFRWNGNTLRNNSRALALGAKTTGIFIWFVILDQRLNMWTSLIGIFSAILLGVFKSIYYFLFFIVWILFVRVFQLFILALGGHLVSLYTIPLMLYTQWMGAIIKIKAYYDLANQKWSKGGEVQNSDNNHVMINSPLAGFIPKVMKFNAITIFIISLIVIHSLIYIPSFALYSNPSTKKHKKHKDTNIIYLKKSKDEKDFSKIINKAIQDTHNKKTTIVLPSSTVDIYQPIIIDKNNITIKGSKNSTIISHLTNKYQSAIMIGGKISKKIGYITKDIAKDETIFYIKSFKKDFNLTKYLLLKEPNTKEFLQKLGSKKWHKKYPYLRQEIVQVAKDEDNKSVIYTTKPFLGNYTRILCDVYDLKVVKNIKLQNFTVKQKVPNDDIKRYKFVYKNIVPKYQVDLIRFDFCANCQIDKVKLLDAGRHPLVFENSYNLTASNLLIKNAWNKGKGGSGYFRIARTYYSKVLDCKIFNIRHLTIQWSSAGNILHNLYMGVDINFHGGFSHDNIVKNINFHIPKKHPWKEIVFTPDDARWAPPDGKNYIDKESIRSF